MAWHLAFLMPLNSFSHITVRINPLKPKIDGISPWSKSFNGFPLYSENSRNSLSWCLCPTLTLHLQDFLKLQGSLSTFCSWCLEHSCFSSMPMSYSSLRSYLKCHFLLDDFPDTQCPLSIRLGVPYAYSLIQKVFIETYYMPDTSLGAGTTPKK